MEMISTTTLAIIISVAFPVFLMMVVLPGKCRAYMFFLLWGIIAFLCSDIIENDIWRTMHITLYSFQVDYAPMVEEIIKTLPLLYFLFSRREWDEGMVLRCGFLCGLGFSMLETSNLVAASTSQDVLAMCIGRCFSTTVMHFVDTTLIALNIVYRVKKVGFRIVQDILGIIIVINIHSFYNELISKTGNSILYYIYAFACLLFALVIYFVLDIWSNRKKEF